ncbi:S1C family serine protease [Clostridium estertheticum]|uniref:S1C family serine protease n=1 Tax=Clostridium estertheticum TaxID=238834 RepID=UPI0013E95BF1|nr:trypsin-like peptidase domain-containing protein [Clostridium estertheticum]MBZ9685951.1 S1C family serine protease [Clostridium estertheticum]
MLQKNKSLIISLVVSFVIIVSGLISAYFIHTTMSKKASNETSKLKSLEVAKNINEKNKDLKTIIHESQKFVVSIEVETDSGSVIGSGFLYNNKGDIITNGHVVSDASSVTIKMADTTVYKGTVIGRSDTTDVALIRVPELAGKNPFKVRKDKNLEIGDEVIALGSPLGLQNTATTGIISGVNRDFNIENYQYKGVYQISAPISPGNSGGPLLDKITGEVLGINSAKVGDETIGFSIPINQVLSLVDGWAANPSKVSNNSVKSNTNIKQNISKEDAEYIVSYFYNSLNSQDYVTAYYLLGSDWQTKTSYDKFRKGYLDTLSVGVESISSVVGSDAIKVVVIISANEKNGDATKLSKYKATYTIELENNILKILHGESAKI